jgi:hypothetical protein
MSRLKDYSKFDKLLDSDDENECRAITQDKATTSRPGSNQSPHLHSQQGLEPVSLTKAGSEKGRYMFEYQGRKIYEWDQTLDGKCLQPSYFIFSLLM